jgi:endonuclease/exonuclease/phosphatase family metal-dependent hydrolase
MPDAPPARVRVLTWNVRWRFGAHWRQRQTGLLRTLRDADVDVVALQECWATSITSQAQEFADQLGLVSATFASPSLPPPPNPIESDDHVGVDVGLGPLSRGAIIDLRQVPLPARHRGFQPLTIVAILAHPAGPLPVVVTCLEWEPAYTDDRIAQARTVVDLATDPSLDGPAPVIVCGDLNAAPDSPVLRPLHDALIDVWSAGEGSPAAVTVRSDHPYAPLEAEELIDHPA